MLTKLLVSNYAIIEEVEITFSNELNVITGETGAGKSILIGALSLILGERADTKVLNNQGKKCVVEGTFQIASYRMKGFFEQHNLDHENESLLRREISPQGRSRAFVNDTPVNLGVLKELGKRLVNLHSQHETLALNSSNFQLNLLDVIAGNGSLLGKFAENHRAYKDELSKLEKLKRKNQEAAQQSDYIRFLYQELEKADLQTGEQESVEIELNQLNNHEEIKQALSQTLETLDLSDVAVLGQLRSLTSQLDKVTDIHPDFPELTKRLSSSLLELEDIFHDFQGLNQDSEIDPSRIEWLNERLSLILRLQKKHFKSDVEELLKLQAELEGQLTELEDISGEIETSETRIRGMENNLQETGIELSERRKSQIPEIEKSVANFLAEMGMPSAQITVQLSFGGLESMASSGMDTVVILFSPNPGSAPQELKRIASGGELSRLMLALKSIIASHAALPTLIFDEIDSGVSGEVANKVGELLNSLGQKHQVICITHLPQIAAKGGSHFFVYKKTEEDSTTTLIKNLNNDERVVEIAKMLSGESVSEAALANARTLLN